MKRLFLPVITIALFTLVAGDRVLHRTPEAVASPAADTSGARTPVLSRAGLPATSGSDLAPGGTARQAEASTSTIERLARLAVRRQLGQAGSATYLDSLLISTDSLVRRWPDRGGGRLGVQPLVCGVVNELRGQLRCPQHKREVIGVNSVVEQLKINQLGGVA